MHYKQACTFYMNMTPWLGLQKLYGRFYTFHECLTVTYIVRLKKMTPLFDFSFLQGTKQAFNTKYETTVFTFLVINSLSHTQ